MGWDARDKEARAKAIDALALMKRDTYVSTREFAKSAELIQHPEKREPILAALWKIDRLIDFIESALNS